MAVLDTLCIELTLRCPLRCSHCSANAAPERQETLSVSILEQRLLGLTGLQEIYLSGGEPFGHPDLLRLVRASRRSAQRVIAYSSGTTLTSSGVEPLPEELIRDAKDAGLTRVDLSIYSTDPDEHDAVTRTPGSLAATLTSAHRFRASGLDVGVHFVPISGASDAALRVLDLAQQIGAIRFHVLALTSLGRARNCSAKHEPLAGIEQLASLPKLLGLEIVLSSALRRALGKTDTTVRDRLRTGFLDASGYLYPGEGQRSPRSRLSLYDGASFADLLADIRVPRFRVLP